MPLGLKNLKRQRMSEAKNRKSRFLLENPRCCFCGGLAPSVECDHQPGRVFFRNREWPEEFVFPACEACNRASRLSEDVVALLVSHFDDEKSRKDYRKRVDSIRRNHPGLLESLLMSSSEARKCARQPGMPLPAGMIYKDLPLVKIDCEKWLPHFRMVGTKLALGQHYTCHRKPMPEGGHIYLSFHTNADISVGDVFDELLKIAPNSIVPQRNKKLLCDQFALWWGASSELGASVFVFAVQKRLIISALCIENPTSVFEGPRSDNVTTPFKW